MVNSLNGLAAGVVQDSLRNQNSRLSANIANTAAGQRIARAFEVISSLSTATSLQTEVSSLRTASLNISQASSFLQVADGGLGQIGGILDRLNAVAVQANSGALSDSGRQGLEAEFQGLVSEIDRIAGNTNFNGVNLLDGSLAESNQLQTSTATGQQASGALSFAGNVNAGETINLNGVSLTEGVDFTAGGTAADTVSNLAATLNNDSRFDGFSFDATGNTLAINADVAGEAGNQFTIDQAGSTANFAVTGDSLTGAGVFSLSGGTDDGLSAGDVSASGSVNDSLITSLDNQAASTTLSFSDASDIQAGDTIQIDDGEGGFANFTFTAAAPANANEIQIGSTLEETLQNTVSTLENFSGAGDFGVRQLDFAIDGNNLNITASQSGNATDVNGAALDVNLGTTGGSITNTQLNNGSTGGIDVSNVTADGFAGTIQGFNATFTGADSAQVSVQVGGETFTANIADTNPNTDSTVTFTSESGGSFDVTLAANNGQSLSNQGDADALATRFDAAFSGVEFRQQRDVNSFVGTGQLVGASLELNSSQFDDLQVDDVSVQSGLGGSAQLEVTVNGQRFRSDADIGQSIGANETVTLRADNGDTLAFANGENEIDLSTNNDARAFEQAFSNGLGLDDGSGGARFQIGSGSDGDIRLSVGNASTEALFNGEALSVLSADGAANALAVIGNAVDRLTAQRADVGAFQQSLDFAAANIESAIQNQEAARSALQDTDILEASTENALLRAQRDASTSTLAQTNRLSGNLLQLLVN